MRSLPRPGDDGVPRRFIAVGLGAGLVLAALTLGGCVAPAASSSVEGATGAEPPAELRPVASAALAGDLVPPGLEGRTWLVGGPAGDLLAGVLGAGRLVVPGERPLAVGDGVVATVLPEGGGSRVVVRAVPGGRVLASILRPEEVLSAAFAVDRLIVGGHLPGSSGRDPGLVAILLRDGSVSALLPPRDLPGWSGDVARTVAASPSGRTVVSGACTMERCAVDVVTLPGGAVRRILDGLEAFPGATTDEVAIVGDGESGWIAGVDLATGERRWTREDGEFQHGYALPDGTFLQAVLSAARGTFTLEVLDPSTGAGRALFARDALEGMTLWPELSNGRLATVARGGRFADLAIAGGIVRAGVVDLSSGDFAPDALAIDLGR